MEFPFNLNVYSEGETVKLAEKFSQQLNIGDIIELNGNLGAGKTFFIKHTLKSFGINNVSSPTFSIVNEYLGKYKVYHFDFYRIIESSELFDIGINDYFNDQEAIIFIEWGNLFPEVLPKNRIEIMISICEDFSRNFKFIKYNG